MYYILNETDQVIAADEHLLAYCNIEHINELSTMIAKGDIGFELDSDENIQIRLGSKETYFSIDKIVFSSLLGKLTLIHISPDSEDENAVESTTSLDDDSSSLIKSIIDDENRQQDTLLNDLTLDTLGSETNEEDEITFDAPHIEEKTDEKPSSLESDLSAETDLLDNDALFDLALDDTPLDIESSQEEESVELGDIPLDFELKKEDDLSLNIPEEDLREIYIDSETISKKIGISNDDYKNFLNDFIDTALSLEKDLQDQDENIRHDAINTLSHLSDVLHLPIIGEIISNIKDNDTQREDIEALYSTLARITTEDDIKEDTTEENRVDDATELELVDEAVQEPEVEIEEQITLEKTPSINGFGTLSLEGIKPKHFDFQLEEAANDLSLPIELIEEFVNDFIEQAHIETKKMLQAYEEGDLDAIQKIGHLLKGASSNLRINALSDTLYKIQFCEDSKNLEMLIKDYWAHFLSFETQINAISH